MSRLTQSESGRMRRAQDYADAVAKRESDAVHADHTRPRMREDCIDGPRPCPWLSCRHNNYLEVSPETGAIKLAHPGREPWDAVESCSLDVAEQGGLRLERVGQILGVTRERVRQIEKRALITLERNARRLQP